MKKRLITVLYALLAVATITACGSDDNSKSEGSKWETESVEKEDTKTEDSSSVEESTKETEVSGVLKSKEELLSENQFYDFYMKLHGYWVNDDQTYYFGSFVKDGELVKILGSKALKLSSLLSH